MSSEKKWKKVKKENQFQWRALKKLNKVEKEEVKTIVNSKIETKIFDANSTISQQYGSGAGIIATDMTAIGLGNDEKTRNGVQITPVHTDFRVTLECQSTNPSAVARIIIFQWRINNAVAPALSSILDAGPGGVVGVYSEYNYDQRHLFKILYDKTLTLNGNTGADNYIRQVVKKLSYKSKAAKVNFDTGAVVTGDHHIYFFMIGSNPNGATGQLATITTRTYYKDG